MHRLIYISKRGPDLSAADVEQILHSARRNNPARDVTGMLIVSPSTFVQALEGNLEDVHAIYNQIQPDERHSDIQVVFDRKVPSRAFPDWSMGFSEQSDEDLRQQADLTGVMDQATLFETLNANPPLVSRMMKNLSTKFEE